MESNVKKLEYVYISMEKWFDIIWKLENIYIVSILEKVDKCWKIWKNCNNWKILKKIDFFEYLKNIENFKNFEKNDFIKIQNSDLISKIWLNLNLKADNFNF